MNAQLHTFTVSDDADGVRLDLFVVSVLPARSRSQIQRLIKDGQVQVAGREARANQPVKAGQQISVEILEPVDAEPAARGAAARHRLSGPRPDRRGQAGGHGRASRRRPRQRHAGERAAPPRRRPERHRRREASGHRPSARSRHVRPDGGGQARRRARGARPSVSRPRGRKGVRRARLGRRSGGTADRCADRARSGESEEDVGPRPPEPRSGDAHRARRASPPVS